MLPNLLVTFEDNTDILIIFLICKFNEELKYQRGENSLCESEFCYHSHTKQNLPQDLCTRCAFCLELSPDFCLAGCLRHSRRPSLTPRLTGDRTHLLSQCPILLSSKHLKVLSHFREWCSLVCNLPLRKYFVLSCLPLLSSAENNAAYKMSVQMLVERMNSR